LDLKETSYGFGYGSLWSLARLTPRPGESSPFASSSDRDFGPRLALVLNVHNIRRGVFFTIKWSPWA
jgi:hypothetical protein